MFSYCMVDVKYLNVGHILNFTSKLNKYNVLMEYSITIGPQF